MVRKLFTSSSDDQISPLYCELHRLEASQAREGVQKAAEDKLSWKPGTRTAKFTAVRGEYRAMVVSMNRRGKAASTVAGGLYQRLTESSVLMLVARLQEAQPPLP